MLALAVGCPGQERNKGEPVAAEAPAAEGAPTDRPMTRQEAQALLTRTEKELHHEAADAEWNALLADREPRWDAIGATPAEKQRARAILRAYHERRMALVHGDGIQAAEVAGRLVELARQRRAEEAALFGRERAGKLDEASAAASPAP